MQTNYTAPKRRRSTRIRDKAEEPRQAKKSRLCSKLRDSDDEDIGGKTDVNNGETGRKSMKDKEKEREKAPTDMREVSMEFIRKMNQIAIEACTGDAGRSLQEAQITGLNSSPDVACGGSRVSLPNNLRKQVEEAVEENCVHTTAVCTELDNDRNAAMLRFPSPRAEKD
ncbi:hypothetical protein V5O48_003992 [Marasmius crinis-equi]|uniref:Uncharacterized protein n=1 Tax=Marasmius crinis-equi TaxID=585013 RepID=A0ABR3FRC2_9AGAR